MTFPKKHFGGICGRKDERRILSHPPEPVNRRVTPRRRRRTRLRITKNTCYDRILFAGWVEHVNSPQTDEELSAIQRSNDRGCPFGDDSWFAETPTALGLEITIRPRGRPKIHKNGF